MNHLPPSLLPALLLGSPLAAQGAIEHQLPPSSPLAAQLASATHPAFARVLHDDPGSGTLWSLGADWKAAFSASGFTYYPYLGPESPRSYAVQFRLVGAHVDGKPLALAHDAEPRREGDRVTYRRGALREIYDMTPRHVEQTLVVDTDQPGDVIVELQVVSDLPEDAERPGLQFGNELGAVSYGDAFLVRDQRKLAIDSLWTGQTIRLHVPAAARGPGPVVIDPIIATSQATLVGPRPLNNPDISYDASTESYLVVWESLHAVGDAEIYCEMFDVLGFPVPGSTAVIDISTSSYEVPRVANDNSTDRFLIVMEMTDPGRHLGRTQIVGRTREAGGRRTVSPEFLISDPSRGGNNEFPDVGGDSGTTAGGLGYPVVWTNGSSAMIEVVRDSGIPMGLSRPLSNGTGRRLRAPRISSSNGRHNLRLPAWCVVTYALDGTNGDGNIYGYVLDDNGTIGSQIQLETGPEHDQFCEVSAPMPAIGGQSSWFMVTHSRDNAAAAQAMVVSYATSGGTVLGRTNLSQAFGFGIYNVVPETDGTRFITTASITGGGIGVATLAFDGTNFRSHEPLRPLPGAPNRPAVASAYAGSGSTTQCAVAFLDFTYRPVRLSVSSYYAMGRGTMTELTTGCGNLTINYSGLNALGQVMSFDIGGQGQDYPGFLLGAAASSPQRICGNCSLGLRSDMPLVSWMGTTGFAFAIPANIYLVGAEIGVQGLVVGQGPCLGGVTLSNTWAFTIR